MTYKDYTGHSVRRIWILEYCYSINEMLGGLRSRKALDSDSMFCKRGAPLMTWKELCEDRRRAGKLQKR